MAKEIDWRNRNKKVDGKYPRSYSMFVSAKILKKIDVLMYRGERWRDFIMVAIHHEIRARQESILKKKELEKKRYYSNYPRG